MLWLTTVALCSLLLLLLIHRWWHHSLLPLQCDLLSLQLDGIGHLFEIYEPQSANDGIIIRINDVVPILFIDPGRLQQVRYALCQWLCHLLTHI